VPPTATWPHGPERPSLGTAAGVLGYVTAGLTIVFSVIFLFVALGGDGDPTVVVLLLGAPCAVGLIVGAGQILRRRSARTLFASAAASVAVLLVALVVGVAVLSTDDLIGEAVFVVLALPLPVLTAVFARNRTVADWLAAGRI
jgi:predicted permease